MKMHEDQPQTCVKPDVLRQTSVKRVFICFHQQWLFRADFAIMSIPFRVDHPAPIESAWANS